MPHSESLTQGLPLVAMIKRHMISRCRGEEVAVLLTRRRHSSHGRDNEGQDEDLHLCVRDEDYRR